MVERIDKIKSEFQNLESYQVHKDETYIEHLYSTNIQNNSNSSYNLEYNTNLDFTTTAANTKDRSKLCFICDSTGIDFFFSCGNGSCLECLEMHIKSQLEVYNFKLLSPTIVFTCISSCKCEENSNLIENIIHQNKELLKYYREIQLKMYINKSKDIIQCPNSKCTNSGFCKSKNSSSNKYFWLYTSNSNRTCISCNICNTQFLDHHTNSSSFFTLINFDIDMELNFKNIKSRIKKFFTTKQCNRCNTPIERDAGCKHIECNRCGFSFCWQCTDVWEGHKEKYCRGILANEYEESLNIDMILLLLVWLILLLVMKVISTFIIILYFLLFLAKLVWLVLFLLLDLCIVFLAFNKLMKYKSKEYFIGISMIFFTLQLSNYWFNLLPFDFIVCSVIKKIVCVGFILVGFMTRLFYR